MASGGRAGEGAGTAISRCAAMACAVAAALIACGAPVARAAPADLDAAFSQDGRVTIDDGGKEAATAIAVQADGRILVAGRSTVSDGVLSNDGVLYRLMPDGRPDTSFSGDGRAAFNNGAVEVINAVAIQPDGKIVVVGSSADASQADGLVYRLTVEGDRDNGFDGDGRKVIDSGGIEYATAVAITPAGKIAIAGSSSNGQQGAIGPATKGYDATVVLLDGEGGYDLQFGGKRGFDAGYQELGEAIAVQPDGSMLSAGQSRFQGTFGLVFRFGPGGTASGYGTLQGITGSEVLLGGAYTSSGPVEAKAIVLQPDGKLLVCGTVEVAGGKKDVAVYRLDASGALDPSFGVGGASYLDAGGDEQGSAIALQPDGGVVVVGSSSADENVVVFRLTPGGIPDAGFGASGLLSITSGGLEHGSAAAIQADGTLLLGGDTTNGPGGGDATVFRLLGASTGGRAASSAGTSAGAGGAADAGGGGGPSGAGGATAGRDLKCAGRRVTISGTNRRDVLRGTARRDVIAGLGGNDLIRGLAGNDLICGGAGNDTLLGGDGADTLRGQGGRDTLRGQNGRDLLDGGDAADALFGGTGRDRLLGGPGRDRQRQ